MNAPVNVQQELMPVPASMREIDRKRYLWMISPALPVIGLGILAGYHFGPRPLKSFRFRWSTFITCCDPCN